MVWAAAGWLPAVPWMMHAGTALLAVVCILTMGLVFVSLRWARLLVIALGVVALLFLGLALLTGGPDMGAIEINGAPVRDWMYLLPCWMVAGALLGIVGGKGRQLRCS
jgi:hypothetical protein